MAYSASTYTFGTGGRGNFSGRLYWVSPNFGVSKRLYLPQHCSAIERHPSVSSYGPRQYLIGGHTRNILIDEDLRVLRQGMQPPPLPAFTLGAGALPMVGYLRTYDEITGERSSLSAGVSLVGGLPRTWATLPTIVDSEELTLEGTATFVAGVVTGVKTNFSELRPGDRVADAAALTRWTQVRSITSELSMIVDDTAMASAGVALVAKPVYRASHLEGWVSVSGSLPRFVWRARIGTPGPIVESIATLALGEALVDSYEPMPTGAFSVIFNDRQVVAGVPGHLDSVYLSDVGFLERHAGLVLRTDFGEPIVGLFCYGTYVVVLAATDDGESSYRLQGYTDEDYELRTLAAKSGGIGHHGNREIPGEIVVVPSSQGMQLFNGAFHPAMPTRETEWLEDCGANIAAFEGGFAAVNPRNKTYLFAPYVHRIEVASEEVPPTLPARMAVYVPACGAGPSATDNIVVFRGGPAPSVTYHSPRVPVIFCHSSCVEASGSTTLFGFDSTVYRMTAPTTPGAAPSVAVLVATCPAPPSTPRVTSILQIDATHYYFGVSGGSPGKVYFWNGSTAPVLSDSVTNCGALTVKLYSFGNDVIALYASAAGSTKTRIRRLTAGVWTDVALPAGYLDAVTPSVGQKIFIPFCASMFGTNANLFIGGSVATYGVGLVRHHTAAIMKLTPAGVLTVAHEATMADLGFPTADDSMQMLAITAMLDYAGILYFGFLNMQPFWSVGFVNTGMIGRTLNGTTFTNIYRNLDDGTVISGLDRATGVIRLFQYDGKMAAYLSRMLDISQVYSEVTGIYISENANIAGSWGQPGTLNCLEARGYDAFGFLGWEGPAAVMPA